MKGVGFLTRKECRWLQCHEAVAEAYACRSTFWKRLCRLRKIFRHDSLEHGDERKK